MRFNERQHVDDAMEITHVGRDGVLDPPPPEDVIFTSLFPPDAQDERITPAILIRHIFPAFDKPNQAQSTPGKLGRFPKSKAVYHTCVYELSIRGNVGI